MSSKILPDFNKIYHN